MENEGELQLSFLLSCSCQALPASYVKLRSYLNIHSAIVASHHSLKLPKYFTSKSITCPYCFLPWNLDTSSCKLLPLKKSNNKRLKKSLYCDNDNFQSTQIKNTMMLKCKVCCKKSVIPLIRRLKCTNTSIKEPEKVKHKKKKKKKDKACGLNKIYLSQNESHDQQLIKNPIKKIKKPQLVKLDQLELVKNKKNQMLSQNQSCVNLNEISSSSFQLKGACGKGKSEKKFFNPYAISINKKISKKNNRQLKLLQQTVEKDKNPIRKSLKDFLTLVGS